MSKISDKLLGVSGIWDIIVKALLAELKKQVKDLVAFWGIAKKLGASTDLATEAGWKLVIADIEWVTFHGTPTPENVAPFLRKKKLLPA